MSTTCSPSYPLTVTWPDIPASGGPDCQLCSWAWHDGRMELKFINRACGRHARYMPGSGSIWLRGPA